eukprot:scaffold124523_cov63-Phaeocystis_antarctica.AAC.4
MESVGLARLLECSSVAAAHARARAVDVGRRREVWCGSASSCLAFAGRGGAAKKRNGIPAHDVRDDNNAF